MSRLKWLAAGAIAGCVFYSGVPVHDIWERWASPSAPAAASRVAPATTFAASLPDFTALVERVGPSVVNVTTRSRAPAVPEIADRHYDIYRGIGGSAHLPRPAVLGIGSGLILGDDGYVLTNAHVIDGADEVFVRLRGNQNELRAKVVGSDRATDIALLKVRATSLPVARTGSSEELKVGDWVAAIGSPFGFENTITAGIISAKERRLPQSAQMPFLQSDVAINPGSSGGPLVNLRGEVVGVNSKIYTRSGGYMGVSFAIPIEEALKITSELRKHGHVARGSLGLETQTVNDVLAASFGLASARGALVTVVDANGPAGRAGIRVGDVVISYGGLMVERPEHFAQAVEETAPGTRTEIVLWRRNAQVRTMAVIAKQDSAVFAIMPGASEQYAGTGDLVLAELSLDQCRTLHIPYGLLVQDLNGTAHRGLEQGDVIVAVNEQPFRTRDEFDRLLSERNRAAGPAALLVMRAGRSLYVALGAAPL